MGWKPLFTEDGSFGAIRPARAVNVFGRSDLIPAGESDIVDVPTNAYRFLKSPERITVTSNDLEDAPEGDGLRIARVIGLSDWDGSEVFEDVALGGSTSQTFVSINRLVKPHRPAPGEPSPVGSLGANKGTISAVPNSGGAAMANILPLVGSSQMAVYTWPLNYRLYVSGYYATVNKRKEIYVDVAIWFNTEPTTNVDAFVQYHPRGMNRESPIRHTFNPYAMIDGPAVLKMIADPNVADGDVTAGMGGYLRFNPPPAGGEITNGHGILIM